MASHLKTGLCLISNRKILKLLGGFNKFSCLQQPRALENQLINRYLHQFKPDNEDEEIVVTVVDDFVSIGINIPHKKNLLTETALLKLHDSIKNFDENDKLSSAVLFGYGGNFCTGLVPTSEAVELGHSLLETLNTIKKPIVGALEGCTMDFGWQLAVMCDMRVVEEQVLIGSNKSSPYTEIPPFVYERLILTVGLGRAAELIYTQSKWHATDCLTAGLASGIVETGCCLGRAMVLAKSVAFKAPLEKIIKQKSKVLSILPRKVK